MENHPYIFPLLVSVVVSLGFVSCTLCVAAEFKKSKVKDLSVDGKLCSLPESAAFRLGLAALACSSVAQIIGNLLLCGKLMSKERECSCRKTKKPKTAIFFLVLSWMSFGVAAILIGAATSMSRRQAPGEGWLDGECYIVKDGVYFGSALLLIITLALTIASAIFTRRTKLTTSIPN
ncbi:protein MODIFYING WALL LIGNIN-1 isoform X1 [Ipomoea triloba]|uniref:protein MODIFYING WALL LIGNIN-1 isoform X1 n=2 Tax=Ipomoea triloba TaxID=35885 RepID=UPI00125E8CA3|nr:protein MODIFYING WALL LIGNIN-1 isoform X1 [Ipomoea triloba]